MIYKAATTLILLAAAAGPAFAQMTSSESMASGDATMAPMKAMSAVEKALMVKCAKMSPAAERKHPKCAQHSATQPAAHS